MNLYIYQFFMVQILNFKNTQKVKKKGTIFKIIEVQMIESKAILENKSRS